MFETNPEKYGIPRKELSDSGFQFGFRNESGKGLSKHGIPGIELSGLRSKVILAVHRLKELK
jgi:hypothetical protein